MDKQAAEIERLTKEVLHWQDVAAEEMTHRMTVQGENHHLRTRVAKLCKEVEEKASEVRNLRIKIDGMWKATEKSIPKGL